MTTVAAVDEPQLSWRFSVSGPWGLVHILGDESFIWRCDFITVPVADVTPFSWVNELRQDMQRYAVTGGDGVAQKWRDSFAWQRLPKFTAAVLQHVITIETLRPMTYGQVAAAIGRPRSARAVGQALGRNPWPVLIPCHRVVAQNGLGGYCGNSEAGQRRKQSLLDFDRGWL